MVQDCEEFGGFIVEVELGLHAEQPFVQPIHLEDGDKSEVVVQLVVVVEQEQELVDSF